MAIGGGGGETSARPLPLPSKEAAQSECATAIAGGADDFPARSHSASKPGGVAMRGAPPRCAAKREKSNAVEELACPGRTMGPTAAGPCCCGCGLCVRDDGPGIAASRSCPVSTDTPVGRHTSRTYSEDTVVDTFALKNLLQRVGAGRAVCAAQKRLHLGRCFLDEREVVLVQDLVVWCSMRTTLPGD